MNIPYGCEPTPSQRAAANLGQCCLELSRMGTPEALRIRRELSGYIGRIEAMSPALELVTPITASLGVRL